MKSGSHAGTLFFQHTKLRTDACWVHEHAHANRDPRGHYPRAPKTFRISCLRVLRACWLPITDFATQFRSFRSPQRQPPITRRNECLQACHPSPFYLHHLHTGRAMWDSHVGNGRKTSQVMRIFASCESRHRRVKLNTWCHLLKLACTVVAAQPESRSKTNIESCT